jgi:hypothetical protein
LKLLRVTESIYTSKVILVIYLLSQSPVKDPRPTEVGRHKHTSMGSRTPDDGSHVAPQPRKLLTPSLDLSHSYEASKFTRVKKDHLYVDKKHGNFSVTTVFFDDLRTSQTKNGHPSALEAS